MKDQIRIVGKAHMNFEIGPRTAYNVFIGECMINSIDICDNERMYHALKTIDEKYGKVFGKVDENGEFKNARIPVRGVYTDNGIATSLSTTTDEVIKGLFHVFSSSDLSYIKFDDRGIYIDNWARGTATSLGDMIHMLYEGKDAAEVFEAMTFVRDHWNKFIKSSSDKSK